jgi:hypothetical protein
VRYTKLLVTALAATLFAVVGAASPAQAAEFSVCTTGFGSGCTTRSVQAEGGNVWIGLYAPPVGACYYRVIDANNGIVVRSGSFVQAYATTINGLYSRYYVKLFSCPGFAEAHISG